MAQFDIYENPRRDPDEPIEYLLDLQAGILEDLSTRVVAPLVRPEAIGAAMRILNPKISVLNEPFILLTHLLAAIPTNLLGQPLDSAKGHRDDIVRSIDFLLTGV